jgi:hypothetical protein
MSDKIEKRKTRKQLKRELNGRIAELEAQLKSARDYCNEIYVAKEEYRAESDRLRRQLHDAIESRKLWEAGCKENYERLQALESLQVDLRIASNERYVAQEVGDGDELPDDYYDDFDIMRVFPDGSVECAGGMFPSIPAAMKARGETKMIFTVANPPAQALNVCANCKSHEESEE